MNTDEREILLEQSKILRELLHHQMSADRSMRALFLALKAHFPKLAKEQPMRLETRHSLIYQISSP
jgi:hypothetical protein